MRYIWRRLESGDVDEPSESWSELDGGRRELRRVELYPDGQMYACGGERGREEALSREPFPEDLSALEGTAREVPASVFFEVWLASLERPDPMMGMFM